MDFHKISEDADVEVYQAMVALDTKPAPDGTEVRKYGPEMPKTVNEATVKQVFDAFSGYQLDRVSVSLTGGITARVLRDKDNEYVEREPNVERLESRKGGKSK